MFYNIKRSIDRKSCGCGSAANITIATPDAMCMKNSLNSRHIQTLLINRHLIMELYHFRRHKCTTALKLKETTNLDTLNR